MAIQAAPEPIGVDIWAAGMRDIADDVERWADEWGWATHRAEKRVDDGPPVGVHVLPFVRVRTPYGQLHLDPDSLYVVGADARMTLEGWPTLDRAILIGRDGRWTVVNDQMVPYQVPWGRELFGRLADDLLRVPK